MSGGRGVGSPENFSSLEDLAELIGGVVGCTRVVTNNGWRSHSDQVGQTETGWRQICTSGVESPARSNIGSA